MSKILCTWADCQEDLADGGETCLSGATNCKDCQNYVGGAENNKDTAVKKDSKPKGFILPWYGTAMGKSDIQILNFKSPPFIIGVVGDADAGKTSMLGALYLQLKNGKNIGDFTFAGSYSLLGWEIISQSLTFKKRFFSFPPHTSSNTQRIPGLLHLILKDKNGLFRDVLFTDAPGEWFKEWSISAESEAARGAKWIDDNADAFIIVADCKAFNNNIGKSRLGLMSLVSRMANTNGNRPTALVWTKSDEDFKEEYKARLSQKVQVKLPHAERFDIALINRKSEEDVSNILNFTDMLLTDGINMKNPVPFITPKNTEDFFFVMR